ncbi:hypothetical protein [Acetobacter persici]|uniref:Uncharacterized protein n=1 Tax=Acetobacter persici TaxID=1076596 RepID=A0A6V8I7I9_9PROT|nr:hypothetical protein [Acetobacter persici]OUI89930.1 hypothetical protein HK19_13465 [Acetobacter persici]GFE93523.1 hypothetical protein DmAi_15820 [Acetobacter persici]
MSGVTMQTVMDQIFDDVLRRGPEVNGTTGLKITQQVSGEAKALLDLVLKRDRTNLDEVSRRAADLAALAVWQVILLRVYANAEKTEAMAASAMATKH